MELESSISAFWKRSQTFYAMGAKPSSVSKPGKYQPQNGSGVESNNPSSSLEPPRVSSYIFEESPAYPESPLIHTLVVTGLEVITEGQEHNGGTSQPDTTTATQPPSPSWSPPLPQPLNQSASTPYEPAPVALDPIRNVSPSGTYLPLSLLLERTGRSWPNHIRVASGQPAWNIPDTGPMPPELLDMRAEMARQATRYIADDAASPAEAPHGISYELDITPPISRSTPRFPGLGFNATGPASPLGSNSNLIPPVSNIPMDTPGLGPRDRIASGSPILGPQSPDISTQGPADTNHASEIIQPSYYDTTKPTCSLNLVCYRSGSRGCDLQQIHCVLRSMYSSEESFQSAVASQPHLVYSDDQFFREMKRLYTRKMCGLFRRYFSLKTLRAFRILSVSPEFIANREKTSFLTRYDSTRRQRGRPLCHSTTLSFRR